jgi:N-acetyl-alpha-D-muramate 1-phosphate uridylyltransferase
MKALILAAGRGERMRPLTDTSPKPLLQAGGKALIEWQIERLARGGFCELVINHARLGAMIEHALGDGTRYGVTLHYSPESRALETAGGIAQALAWLDSEPFVVVSADVYTDYDYARLRPVLEAMRAAPQERLAHFVLVDNPAHHSHGDLSLEAGVVGRTPGRLLNYAGISVFQPHLFAEIGPGTKRALFPWMFDIVATGKVTGEHYRGIWFNVGTPQQLSELDAMIRDQGRRGWEGG